jgi:hypothetical protein
VGIAFDLMTVTLADLPRLPALVPPLKLLFELEEKEEDAAQQRREGSAELQDGDAA